MKLLWCLLRGHEWVSFSVPVMIPDFPEVTRIAKRVCPRCRAIEYAVNEL